MCEGSVHNNRIGEQVGVGNDDAPAIVRADERRAGLDVLDRAFMRPSNNLTAALQYSCRRPLRSLRRGSRVQPARR
jgi:hypothetical protein